MAWSRSRPRAVSLLALVGAAPFTHSKHARAPGPLHVPSPLPGSLPSHYVQALFIGFLHEHFPFAEALPEHPVYSHTPIPPHLPASHRLTHSFN